MTFERSSWRSVRETSVTDGKLSRYTHPHTLTHALHTLSHALHTHYHIARQRSPSALFYQGSGEVN
jgi:hypothetical protein